MMCTQYIQYKGTFVTRTPNKRIVRSNLETIPAVFRIYIAGWEYFSVLF